MNAGAGVTSLAVLHDWYAALAEFRTEAQDALTALALSLQRADDWLGEQQQYWQRQIRACEDEVSPGEGGVADAGRFPTRSADSPTARCRRRTCAWPRPGWKSPRIGWRRCGAG